MRHYSIFTTDVCQYGQPRVCLSVRRMRQLSFEYCLFGSEDYKKDLIECYLHDASLMDIVRWAETKHGYEFDDNGRYYTSMYNVLTSVYGIPVQDIRVLRASSISVVVYSK